MFHWQKIKHARQQGVWEKEKENQEDRNNKNK